MTEDFDYELWAANEIGELIASAPKERYDAPKQTIREFLINCTKFVAGGNVSAFARITGVEPGIIYGCVFKNSVPATAVLLKICYRLGVSFSRILTATDIPRYIESSIPSVVKATSIAAVARSNSHRARPELIAALQENPIPSLQEVAGRVGYKLARSLRKRCPELSKLLTEKRKAIYPKLRRRSSKKALDHDDLKRALQEALKEEMPPALHDLAERLGFHEAKPLRRNFGKLCDAIVARRAEYLEKTKAERRTNLEAILYQLPPPCLTEVAKRLGYESGGTLQGLFPDLAEAISKRYLNYRSAKSAQVLDKLQALLLEDPPLSMHRVARSLKKSPDTLRKHFPQECRAIVIRYAEFGTRSSIKRKSAARARLREIAMHLYTEGIYPSRDQVRKTFNRPTGLNTSELCDLLRKVRFELGLRKRRRSS